MFRAFLRTPSGVIGLAVIGLLVVVMIVAPILWSAPATDVNVAAGGAGPSAAHWLGTDQLGRDILLRVLVATRFTIVLALIAAGIGALLGVLTGSTAALLPRRARSVALRAIDAMLAFPGILVAIFIGTIIGPGATGATIGVAIAVSFSFARISSTLAMSAGGRDYVAAGRVLGIRPFRLLVRHVLPNIADTLVITTTVVIGTAVVDLSSLSFLGLGVQPPDFDWGQMLTEGVQVIYTQPWAAVGPAVAIAITAVAFGLTGEALARNMNPVLWTQSRHAAPRVSARQARRAAVVAAADSVADTSPDVVLDVRDLVVEFPGRDSSVRVLDGVSFQLRKGEFLGIVGESGSGKSLTALAIAQLVPFPGEVSGTVRLDGQDIGALSRRDREAMLGTDLAFVFQDPLSSLNPALRIRTQLTESIRYHRRVGRRSADETAVGRLGDVSIPAPDATLRRHPHELSGGMRQRVMIAKGLMKNPVLLFADEPTTALDVTIQSQIMALLESFNADDGMSLVFISHNLALVSENCARVLVMYAGRIVEDLTTEQLLAAPLHPYTTALLHASPDITAPRTRELTSIPGQVPDFAAMPPGCPYHPRCPLAVARCRVELPPLAERSDGRRVACWVANQDLGPVEEVTRDGSQAPAH
ncbi:MAG TPA: dipeptide/oligopeptide/nickel ABC transporter permease/ATP-binding protein [Actinophytocola sp.]|nr:dipeptide/oligopeptide/nickel ABC transporter permease/ATP-binding protein [Actinophytocola sp.]